MQQERSCLEVGAYRTQLLLAQDRLPSIYNYGIAADPPGNPVFPHLLFPHLSFGRIVKQGKCLGRCAWGLDLQLWSQERLSSP